MRTLAAALLCLAACGGKETQPASGPAGEVVRVEGSVTATRADDGAKPRVLTRAAEVFADDTVVTADDGSVDIRLAHNGAVWKLGPGEARRVDASAAWRAPKGSSDESAFVNDDEDRTASAGRHTDMALEEGKMGTIGHGGGSGSGSGYGHGGYGLRGNAPKIQTTMGTATVDGALDKDVIRRVMRSRFPALRRCYDLELADDPKFEVDVTVLFTVDTSGRLSPITVDPEPTPRFTACLKAAMRAVQMPEAETDTEVSLPLSFRRQ